MLDGSWDEIDCLIDTGFSGGLALPQEYEHRFPANEFVESRFVLADGSEVTVNTTYTTVSYSEQEKEVAIVFMGHHDEANLQDFRKFAIMRI